MNFAFSVVCKVPNSFAKSKNSPTPRDFAFRLGKPKVWTPSLNFFFTDRAGAFFFPIALYKQWPPCYRRYLAGGGARHLGGGGILREEAGGRAHTAAGGTAGTRGSWRAGGRGREGGRT